MFPVINSFFLLCLLCSWNYDGGAADRLGGAADRLGATDRLPRRTNNNGDEKKSGKVRLPVNTVILPVILALSSACRDAHSDLL